MLFKKDTVKQDLKLYITEAQLLLTKIQLSETANQLVEARLGREEKLLFPYVDYNVQSYRLEQFPK